MSLCVSHQVVHVIRRSVAVGALVFLQIYDYRNSRGMFSSLDYC
jgi:hypothetical protein